MKSSRTKMNPWNVLISGRWGQINYENKGEGTVKEKKYKKLFLEEGCDQLYQILIIGQVDENWKTDQ